MADPVDLKQYPDPVPDRFVPDPDPQCLLDPDLAYLMRSAMVRSSSSSSTSMTSSFPPLPPTAVTMAVEDLESPVESFQGGRLMTTNTSSSIAQHQKDNDDDPNTLYTYCRPDPVVAVTQPAFFIQSARIYPLDAPGDTASTAKKKYVCYEIALDTAQQQQGPPISQQQGTIFRRYTDFLQLYDNLRRDYSSLMQATVFPKKCFMGNFSAEVVSPRVTLFTEFLQTILSSGELRDSEHFLSFLQDQELHRACRLLDERRAEEALPILENVFVLLNKVYTNRSKDVLLVLCRLVAASAHPVPTPDANYWADLALRRFEGVCDADLLQLYVPLIKSCIYLFWKTGRDKTHLDAQIDGFRKRGINVKTGPTLSQAIHALDPRTESA